MLIKDLKNDFHLSNFNSNKSTDIIIKIKFIYCIYN